MLATGYLVLGKYQMSYKYLEIGKQAKELVIDIQMMSLNELPKFEMYEIGNQHPVTSKKG